MNQKKQKANVKPLPEKFKKIEKEACVGIMKNKDGTIEKRKL